MTVDRSASSTEKVDWANLFRQSEDNKSLPVGRPPINSFIVGQRNLKGQEEEIHVETGDKTTAAPGKVDHVEKLIQERSTPTSTPSSSLSSGTTTVSIEHLELPNVSKKDLFISKRVQDAIMKLPCAGPYMEIMWENTIKQFNVHNGMHCILVDENCFRAPLAGHLYLLFRMMFFFLSVALFDPVPRTKALHALHSEDSMYKIIDSPELFEYISSHPMVNTAKGFLRKAEYFKDYLKDNIMGMGGAKTYQKLQWMLQGAKLETLKVSAKTYATHNTLISIL
jgi:hypothetical protein